MQRHNVGCVGHLSIAVAKDVETLAIENSDNLRMAKSGIFPSRSVGAPDPIPGPELSSFSYGLQQIFDNDVCFLPSLRLEPLIMSQRNTSLASVRH